MSDIVFGTFNQMFQNDQPVLIETLVDLQEIVKSFRGEIFDLKARVAKLGARL